MPVFLFTDIEGSTQLWEQRQAAMGQALMTHDAILREQIEKYGGDIVKHTGDGVFAVFERGRPLLAAINIQKELAAVDWGSIENMRVRIVLHAGEAERRGNDYVGLAVSQAARLLPVGWGGQILLTPAVMDVAALPPDASVKNLGTHLLRDLSDPQTIYTLTHPDLPRQKFPPLRSLAAHSHNLPAQLTPFIGRQAELVQIRRQLQSPDCRLLTLVGPGGIGKTRIALQVAADLVDAYAHGVYFVSLAPVEEAKLIAVTIAGAINFSFYGQQSAEDQLLHYLRDKKLLLILDNFEHLLPGAAFLERLLQISPSVKLLITSRERLNLRQERVFSVGGMEFPKYEQALWPAGDERLASENIYDAVELFMQTVRRTRPDFVFSDSELAAVVRICHLVEGMPLGLELAAAWVRVLSCQEIADEIAGSLDFLTARQPQLSERHHSLKAVFDYLWSLLSPAERSVMRQLAVFRGGFQRDAAQKVAGASFFFLSSLIDKALLREPAAGKYEMHEVLRQYATERLQAHPDELEDTLEWHGRYYAGLLARLETGLRDARQQSALAEIDWNKENVRGAWHWAIEQLKKETLREAAVDILHQIIESLYVFYETRGWFQDGVEILDRALIQLRALPQPTSQEQLLIGRILSRQGNFYLNLTTDQEAQHCLEEALAIIKEVEEGARRSREKAFGLFMLGQVEFWRGVYEKAKLYFEQSLAIYEQLDLEWGIGLMRNWLGNVAYLGGQLAEAKELYMQSLAISRRLGYSRGIADTLNNLGNVSSQLGEFEAATRLIQESLDTYRHIGYQKGIALAHNNLGHVATMSGEFHQAQQMYQSSLAIHQTSGNQRQIAFVSKNLGDVAAVMGELDQAMEYYHKALGIYQEIDDQREVAYSYNHLGDVARIKKDYERAAQLYRRGLALFETMNLPAGVCYSLDNLGVTARLQEKLEEAERLHKRSMMIQEELDNQEGIAFSFNNLGRVALDKGETDKALALFQKGLDAFSKIGVHRGIVLSYNNMADAALQINDFMQAARYYCQAARLAVDINAPRLVMYPLVGLSALLARDVAIECGPDCAAADKDKTEIAVELLTFCRQHYASDADTQAKAGALLAELGEQLPERLFARAAERGRRLSLPEVIAAMFPQE